MPRYPRLWLVCQAVARAEARAGLVPIAERRAADHQAAAALTPPPAGLEITDLAVPADGRSVPVRLYRPAPATGPQPVHLLLHGGGFVAGSLAQVDGLAREYAAAADCAVVSVDYRLAPEHPWPAAPEDGFAVLQWLAGTGGSLGLDPDRISVGGVSVGGGIAAAVTLLARDRDAARPVFQLLEIPCVDLTLSRPSVTAFATGYLLSRAEMVRGVDAYTPDPDDRRNPYASPLLAEDLTGLPPALVVTAQYDLLRDEGEEYARRLGEAGVPARTVQARGHIHASVYSDMRSARRYRRIATDALRAALHPKPSGGR